MSEVLSEKDKKLGLALARLRDGLQGFTQVIEAIDEYLQFLGKPLEADHPEVYDKLNWEGRTGDKGPFEMLRKDNCNDTKLFNHLDMMLKQNKGNISIGDFHYWAGQEGFIFRRKKKN